MGRFPPNHQGLTPRKVWGGPAGKNRLLPGSLTENHLEPKACCVPGTIWFLDPHCEVSMVTPVLYRRELGLMRLRNLPNVTQIFKGQSRPPCNLGPDLGFSLRSLSVWDKKIPVSTEMGRGKSTPPVGTKMEVC